MTTTFKAVLKRRVTVIERADVVVEAETQAEAEEAAVAASLDAETLSWTETDVSESEIGEPEVESVVLHSYDGDDEIVETT